jgi:flagellar basal body P-ring formation protein FlgA
VPTADADRALPLLADGATAADATAHRARLALARRLVRARADLRRIDLRSVEFLDTRRIDCLREREALPATVGDDSFIFARQVPADRLLTWQDVARRPSCARATSSTSWPPKAACSSR